MSKVKSLFDVGGMMKIAPFAVACVVIFAGFHTFLSGLDVYVEYDLDEMNEFLGFFRKSHLCYPN